MLSDLMIGADTQILETEAAVLKLIEERNKNRKIIRENIHLGKLSLARMYLNSK